MKAVYEKFRPSKADPKSQNRKFTIVFRVNLFFLLLSLWGLVQFLLFFCCAYLPEIDIDSQSFASNQQLVKKKYCCYVKIS